MPIAPGIKNDFKALFEMCPITENFVWDITKNVLIIRTMLPLAAFNYFI